MFLIDVFKIFSHRRMMVKNTTEPEILQEGIIFLTIFLPETHVLVMKKLEIENLSPFLLYQF